MVSSYILFTRKLIILTTYPQNRARVPYYRDRNADCVRLYDFSEADDVRLAKGVYTALEALGLSIPGDVSVIAHDDHLPQLRASAFFPALSVTKAPLRDSWGPLVDCLNGLLDGAPLADLQIVGCHEMILRNSTGPAPA